MPEPQTKKQVKSRAATLIKAILATGMSAEALAAELGVSFNSVQRWKGEEHAPHARTMRDLERLQQKYVKAA